MHGQKRKLMESKSFEDSVIQLYPELYHYAYSLIRDEDAAKDLTQETVLKALGKQHMFQQGTNLSAWLHRILYYKFVNNYHKVNNREFRMNQYLDYELDSVSGANFHSDFLPFEIEAAIEALPVGLSDVIQLYINGYKYVEIAKKLSIPEGTVKNRMHVARKRLRIILS